MIVFGPFSWLFSNATFVCWDAQLISCINAMTIYIYVFFFQIFRDGKWIEEEASILVPGDVISIKLGDIIPADARLLDGDPLKIDQVLSINPEC